MYYLIINIIKLVPSFLSFVMIKYTDKGVLGEKGLTVLVCYRRMTKQEFEHLVTASIDVCMLVSAQGALSCTLYLRSASEMEPATSGWVILHQLTQLRKSPIGTPQATLSRQFLIGTLFPSHLSESMILWYCLLNHCEVRGS